MPYGVLLYRRSTNRLGCACSSSEARALHAPRQEVTGGRDGPTRGGSRQSSSEFGLQPERHAPAGPVCAAARGLVSAAADTAPSLDCPRCLLGCQAMFRPPIGSATRSTRRCALPHLIAPRGAQR